MSKLNEQIKEKYLGKYPKANYLGSDRYFDNYDSFENYMQIITAKCEQDYPDFCVRVANEAEFDSVADWIERLRKDERNDCIDAIVGIEKATEDFFVMAYFRYEE